MAAWTALLNAFTAWIEWTHGLVGSYGLAIVIVTIIIRAALWPLTQAQVRSMRRMQELQPEVQRLQTKFKGDRERLNQETMRLWRENHVNPTSGCLPMILQLPILWAIYRVLEGFHYTGPTGFLWLKSLSVQDPTFVLPIVGGLTTYWQTRISTVQQNNPQGQMMTYIMPLFIAYIFWRLPAGVAVYWVISNLFSVAQQYAVGGPPRPRGATPGGATR
ncbi:MAG TPA: YidC/Oxa1 family membrane protein insertase [Bacillota bacterium]|nr:YidC/Oxa1 family membrane protein insertase [Bacillota bacterium]